MFVCLDCGALFEKPEHWVEKHGFDYGPFEEWSGCPFCGEPYVEAHKCSCCDEWIIGTYIKTNNNERICENCYTIHELEDEYR